MSCLFLAGVTNWLGIKLIFNRIPGLFFRYDKTIYVADFAETKESRRLSFFLFFFCHLFVVQLMAVMILLEKKSLL